MFIRVNPRLNNAEGASWMITTTCLNTRSKQLNENCLAADISELRLEEDNIIWADVSDPTSGDFEELAEEFGFHPLSIEDCRNETNAPRSKNLPDIILSCFMKRSLRGQVIAWSFAS